MICLKHRGERTPCALCELEARLPTLYDGELAAIASYLEHIPEQQPLTGQIQGECLHIAGLIRELARKLAA